MRRFDRIIFHIGKHKTGTSSIQASLFGLDQDGVRYAELQSENHGSVLKATFSPRTIERKNEREYRRSAEHLARIRAEAKEDLERALKKPARTLIFSAEALENFSSSEVSGLISSMDRYTTRVEVIGFVRPPHSSQISSFQEVVKRGYSHNLLRRTYYRKAFEPYLNILDADAVRILPFDPANFVEGSLLKTFLHGIGEPQVKCEERRSNEGMSGDATRLLFLHNQSQRFPVAGQKNSRARGRLWRKIAAEIIGPKLKLPDECYFSPGLEKEVEWLKSVSGIDFSADLGRMATDQDAASEAMMTSMAEISDSAVERLREVVAEETGREPKEKPRQLMAQLYRFYGGRREVQ